MPEDTSFQTVELLQSPLNNSNAPFQGLTMLLCLKTRYYSLEMLEVAFRSCHPMLARFFFYDGQNLLQRSTSVEKLSVLVWRRAEGKVPYRYQVRQGTEALWRALVAGYSLYIIPSSSLWFWRPWEVKPSQLPPPVGKAQTRAVWEFPSDGWCAEASGFWAFRNGPCIVEIYTPLFWTLPYIQILAEKPEGD